MIIELDGETHSTEEEIARDKRPTDYLQEQNYRVVRFVNAEVYENVEAVAEAILSALIETAR